MGNFNLRRTWAEIDLDALTYNYQKIRNHIAPSAKFMGVVKANAYGHGAVQIATKLEELGADYLAVATIDEARELRDGGIRLPVLILGHTPVALTEELIKYDITQSVSGKAKAEAYSAAAMACGKRLKTHIKVDTGMSRLGFRLLGDSFERSINDIKRICSLPGIHAEGIFTHFAVSDETNTGSMAYTDMQWKAFQQAIFVLEKRGVYFRLRHCANSGAIVWHPKMHLDMVRAGVIMYGAGEGARQLKLKPVMRLKTCIYDIKTFEAGAEIGYGLTFRTDRESRIGVVPIGYADGLFRGFSNHLKLWTEHGSAPICGRICMDMTMVDLTDLTDECEGSEMEIFGTNQSVDDLATSLGTISYELLCAVNKRVPRIYKG